MPSAQHKKVSIFNQEIFKANISQFYACTFVRNSKMCIALKYKAQTSWQSPHLIRLFLWLIKYWYILNKITFRNLPEKKTLLLKKLNNHCLEPFFTCSGGHDTVRSHELRLGSNNYTARPYSLVHLRGAFNQECESIHKIRMNKGTEVFNSL